MSVTLLDGLLFLAIVVGIAGLTFDSVVGDSKKGRKPPDVY